MIKQFIVGNKTELLARIQPLLQCLKCSGALNLEPERFVCESCLASYPVINGIPRFTPENFYERTQEQANISEKTKNYFGFQWDYFKEWGFIPDEQVEAHKKSEVYGGTVAARKSAFDKKCRMAAEDLSLEKIVLDAGCGNGRYTYEAASRGDALVIGVDIGYGSVMSAYENNMENPNVLILQASLLELPFKNGVLDSCFSNGVLMHTGNARQAFKEIARCVKPAGVLVAHVYHRMNPFWELNDFCIRMITTRLSIEKNLVLAGFLASLARKFDRSPKLLKRINYFVRLLPTQTHMFDWYSAPVASHHTYEELAVWFKEAGFTIRDSWPKGMRFFNSIWGINLKGEKK